MSVQLCNVGDQKHCTIHQNTTHMKALELTLGLARAASLCINLLVAPASLAQFHEANKEIGGGERSVTRQKARGGHLNFIRQVNPAGLSEAKTTYSE